MPRAHAGGRPAAAHRPAGQPAAQRHRQAGARRAASTGLGRPGAIATLRRRLADPALSAQPRALAAGAPAAAVSLRIELGRRDTDWLAALPASAPFWYQARPAQAAYRLGIGHALQVGSAGPSRFAALDNAFAGLRDSRRHDRPALAFCGFAFDERSQAPLPNALLAVPAILLEARDGRCQATLSTTAGRIAQAATGWLKLLADPVRAAAYRLLPAHDPTLVDRAVHRPGAGRPARHRPRAG